MTTKSDDIRQPPAVAGGQGRDDGDVTMAALVVFACIVIIAAVLLVSC